MKLNTFIVDDEEHSIEVSTHYLTKYCSNVRIVGHAYNVSDAVEAIEKSKVDLVLLDINLKGGELGFELIKRMPFANFKVIILSANSEYGIHAVKHNVCDYLLKPLNAIELVEAIEKVATLKKSTPANMGKLAISEKAGINLIDIEEINYLEADGNYTHLYLDGRKEVITLRIGELIDKLPTDYFQRIHRTFVVNINAVKKVVKKRKHTVVMSDDKELPVSRALRDSFHKSLENRVLLPNDLL